MARKFKIGLALGSGGARGWAHIGVIQALAECGIDPDIVCGTSTGALVGAAWLTGQLEALQVWSRKLGMMGVLRMLDPGVSNGGIVAVGKAFAHFRNAQTDIAIEKLPKPFSAVATDIATGHEIWLREGPMLESIQASSAIPGLFPAVHLNDRWLVDGALVNPVPVSLCRAMGANIVIAINLSGGIPSMPKLSSLRWAMESSEEEEVEAKLKEEETAKKKTGFWTNFLLRRKTANPTLLESMAASLDIMQDRITRSRLAGDPPDVMVSPRVAHIGILEFDRADELIAIGKENTLAMRPAIELAIMRG